MEIEQKNQFIKIENTLIRISKIDSIKKRYVVKANTFGRVSDESYPEIIINLGADHNVFIFETEQEQQVAYDEIEKIVSS